MPRLQILNGKRQGATIDIGRGETVVGHRNTAPVCIDDPWVSWDHARLFFQNDSFWIEDLGSTNGTYVNCVRVKRERINHEDIIFFGKTHVIFLVPDATEGSTAGSSLDGKRSDFEIGVEQLAAAAEQWTQPTQPRALGFRNRTTQEAPRGRNDLLAPPTGSAAPAIPVPPHELSDPLRLAGLRGDADESSRPADPWRAGPSPDEDPFASARASAATDPFLDGQGRGSQGYGQPGQHVRPFADTHLDGDALENRLRSNAARGPDLEDFAIDDQDPGDGTALAPASAAEVASLLDRKDTDAPIDDLDALLGDNAARTPDPGLYRIPGATGRRRSEALTRPFDGANAARDIEEASSPTERVAPTAAVPYPAASPANRARPSTQGRTGAMPSAPPPLPSGGSPTGTSRFNAPPLPATPGPAPGSTRFANPLSNARTQTMPTPAPTAPTGAPRVPTTPARTPGLTQPGQSTTLVSPEAFSRLTGGPDESRPVSVGEVAFESAKLQDEVRRLRAALEAAKAQSPEQVRAAVEGLRDQELGRQAREIAEHARDLAVVRKELAEARLELSNKQAELDDVTEDMIKKEDTIDELRRRLAALTTGAGATAANTTAANTMAANTMAANTTATGSTTAPGRGGRPPSSVAPVRSPALVAKARIGAEETKTEDRSEEGRRADRARSESDSGDLNELAF